LRDDFHGLHRVLHKILAIYFSLAPGGGEGKIDGQDLMENPMETVKIIAQRRNQAGKGVARRLRMQGQLPAVLYGNGATVALAFTVKDLVRIQQSEAGENAIVELTLEGAEAETCQAILREVQIHPLHRTPLHADFYRVDMTRTLHVTVPIEFVNIPQDRLKTANVSLHPLRHDIVIACLPGAIPDSIAVDLQTLQVGTAFKAGDIVLPQGLELVIDGEEPVVTTTEAAPGA
jgi:large subunit ribosomal protein L25